MATISNTTGRFELSFAGTPFLLDAAKIVRMEGPKHDGPQAGPRSQQPPEKHQPEPDLLDEIDRLIPFKYLEDFVPSPEFLGSNLDALAAKIPSGKWPDPDLPIGAYYYPTGATRWSVFRGLATSSQVKDMVAYVTKPTALTATKADSGVSVMKTAGVPPSGSFTASPGAVGTVKSKNRPAPFVMRAISNNGDAGDYTVRTDLFMLPPRPLAENGGKFDGLYMVVLVDERFWWQFCPVSAFIKPGQHTTWRDMLDTLSDVLGVPILCSIISSVYTGPEPDSQFWAVQENAAVVLDAVAANIGRTVVRTMGGAYALLTPLESRQVSYYSLQKLGGIARVRVAGGDIFSGPGTKLPVGDLTAALNLSIPNSVDVSFPFYVEDAVPHFLNPRYSPPRQSAWYEDGYGYLYVENVPVSTVIANATGTTGPGVISGSDSTTIGDYVLSIHDTAKALVSSEEDLTPLNKSYLRSLAKQLATDYYSSVIAATLDEVFPGTFDWTTEGNHDIIWTYSARSRLATTRVICAPWNQRVENMQHATPSPGTKTEITNDVSSIGSQIATGGTLYNSAIQFSSVVNVPVGTTIQITGADPTDFNGIYTVSFVKDAAGFGTYIGFVISPIPSENQAAGPYRVFTLTGGGAPYTPKGVGGKSVAQTARDQFTNDQPQAINPPPGRTSLPSPAPRITTTLAAALVSGAAYVVVDNVTGLPTANRWRGAFYSGTSQAGGIYVLDPQSQEYVEKKPPVEVALFEGTSGGIFAPGSTTNYKITVVYRGIDGTSQPAELSNGAQYYAGKGSWISQVAPDVQYGINSWKWEKGAFVYPSAWTSGGIQELAVVPQVQTVRVMSNSGVLLNGIPYYSGKVEVLDATAQISGMIVGGQLTAAFAQYRQTLIDYGVINSSGTLTGDPQAVTWIPYETVWLRDRNSGVPISGSYRLGQFAGFSPTQPPASSGSTLTAGNGAPIYLIEAGGGTAGFDYFRPWQTLSQQQIQSALQSTALSGTVFRGDLCDWNGVKETVVVSGAYAVSSPPGQPVSPLYSGTHYPAKVVKNNDQYAGSVDGKFPLVEAFVPQSVEFVKPDSTSKNATGLYAGYVYLYNPATGFQQAYPVWIKDANG